jgi:peptidoglycan pentaglycine glycine transferase (the first glycine)
MNVKCLAAHQRDAWNAFVARESSFALLQSWEWGEFKEKLGWRVFRVAVEEHGQIVAGAQMLIKQLPLPVASVAYIPRGPIGNWLDNQVALELFTELHRIARCHRAILLKIEPPLLKDSALDLLLQQHHFHASTQTNQPCATLILDLAPDLDTILKNMRKKTRQYIGSTVRTGVVVRIGNSGDLPTLYNLLRMTGQREHFPTHDCTYYEHEWHTFAQNQQYILFMASYQDQILAVRTVHRFGKHVAEFHAGSSGKFNHLHPNYLLTWEAIKWAKAQGCHTYDLWGIPDEITQLNTEKEQPMPNCKNGLWGVYQFKRGFTQNVVCYAGAYDYVYNWTLYGLIANPLLSQNTRERVANWMDSLRQFHSQNKEFDNSTREEMINSEGL